MVEHAVFQRTDSAVVLFDGECNFCNSGVWMMIANSDPRSMRFCAQNVRTLNIHQFTVLELDNYFFFLSHVFVSHGSLRAGAGPRDGGFMFLRRRDRSFLHVEPRN